MGRGRPNDAGKNTWEVEGHKGESKDTRVRQDTVHRGKRDDTGQLFDVRALLNPSNP